MPELDQLDAARYRRIAAWGSAAPLLILAVTSALQSELFQVARGLAAYDQIYAVPLWARLVANLSAVVVLAAVVRLVPKHAVSRGFWISAVLGATVAAAFTRGALQLALGVYPRTDVDLVLVDFLMGMFCAAFSLAVGVALAEAFQRVRRQERSANRHALRASAALDALQAEELRVRREVAEGLHGTVQHKLVLVAAGLRGVAEELATRSSVEKEQLERLSAIVADVDDLREQGVRELSQLLYPAGVSLGLAPAVRMMLQRIPSSISVQAHIDESVVEFDDPAVARVPQQVRLLAVRVLEEAVSNALRHGRSGHIAVTLSMDDAHVLTITVDDDGSGMPQEVEFSGLERLRERLDTVGGALELTAGPLGGARLSSTIPLGQRQLSATTV